MLQKPYLLLWCSIFFLAPTFFAWGMDFNPPIFVKQKTKQSLFRVVGFFVPTQVQGSAFSILSEQGRIAQLSAMTHLIFFTSETHIPLTGSIPDLSVATLENWRALQTEAQKHGVKVIYGFGCNTCLDPSILGNKSTRKNLAKSLALRAKTLGASGVDVDIEYPNTALETIQIGEFLSELRAELGVDPILTFDVANPSWMRSPIGHIPADVIQRQLDWVNIMSYGGGEQNGMEFMKSTVAYFKHTMHIPDEKLVIGLPFFAEATYTDVTGEKKQSMPSWRGLSNMLAPDDFSSDTLKITLADMPQGQQIIYRFNNVDTIMKKTDYAINQAGGVMFWHWSADVTDGHSLTGALISKLPEKEK